MTESASAIGERPRLACAPATSGREVYVLVSGRVAACSFLALSGELMMGGPFGIRLGEWNLRHFMWIGGWLISILALSGRPSVARQCRSHCLLALTLVAIWGLAVPLCNGLGIERSFLECRVLLAMPLFVLARVAIEYLGIRRLLSWLVMLTALPAIAIIAAWGAYVVGGKQHFAMALKDWLANKGEWLSGVYIGPMPGGEYRVMWIVVIFFPFAILAVVSSQIWWALNLVFILAAIASNTRAVVVGALLATATLATVRFRLHWTIVAVVGLLAVAGIIQAAPDTRLVEFWEVFNEGDPRFDQAHSLLSSFGSSPLFGMGFGSSAEIVRSESAPFSYELTYFALLAKVGLVGMLLIACWFVLQMQKVLRLPRPMRVIAFTAILCFVGVTSTNPYLLNLFGIWLVAVLLALLEASSDCRGNRSSEFRRPLSSFSRGSTRAASNSWSSP
jgi:hypothetical protein